MLATKLLRQSTMWFWKGRFLIFLPNMGMAAILVMLPGQILQTFVLLSVTGDAFDRVFLCCFFSHEMSWMRSGTKLGQFLRVFLPILVTRKIKLRERTVNGKVLNVTTYLVNSVFFTDSLIYRMR